MEKTIVLKLNGLSCANCAAKIEAGAGALSCIKAAEINLLNQEMRISCADEAEENEVFSQMEAVVHKYEPDVQVYLKGSNNSGNGSLRAHNHSRVHVHEHGHEHGAEENLLRNKLVPYGTGIALFIAAYALKAEYGGISSFMFICSYLIFGLNVLKTAIKNIVRGQIFDENFLMSISTIGAIAIGELPEAVFVMFFYQIGELFQDMAVDKSRRSIKELMDIRPDYANVERGGAIERIAPDEAKIGDIIVVKPGEKIPLDGHIIAGSAQLDTMALTGESIPRSVSVGDDVLSGSVCMDAVIRIEVTKEFGSSTVVKILEMVENASSKKSRAERFITKFAAVYTPAVVFAAIALAFIPPIVVGGGFTLWIGRALVFLVVSCPCALVLSVPLGFFAGIGEASSKGILVKGSNYISALAGADTVVLDKTGTLTKGSFAVNEILPADGISSGRLLELAAKAEKLSNHPIAKSIVCLYEAEHGQIAADAQSYEELGGLGVIYREGSSVILAGNKRLMDKNGISCPELGGEGSRVYIAENGGYIGAISVADEIKPDSLTAVKKLKAAGIKRVIMLTGDNSETAAAVAGRLSLDGYYAGLLPDQKVERLEEIMKDAKRTIFVGDGINDAPVLARADIGAAMGGLGSDAAIEAADMVIMNDEVSKIAEGISIARGTVAIVNQNIVFALGVKFIVLVLGAFGYASMWAAVFADVGVAFIAVCNSMRKKSR